MFYIITEKVQEAKGPLMYDFEEEAQSKDMWTLDSAASDHDLYPFPFPSL